MLSSACSRNCLLVLSSKLFSTVKQCTFVRTTMATKLRQIAATSTTTFVMRHLVHSLVTYDFQSQLLNVPMHVLVRVGRRSSPCVLHVADIDCP